MKRFVAVFAFMLLAVQALPALAVDDALSIEANQKYLDENAKKKGVIVRPSGLQFRIIQNGYGKRPSSTDTVQVYYTGTLINHVVFDGTSPGLPASLKLNSVIPGWIEALQLMREGDHWLLTIPPNLGYGSRSMGDGAIPDTSNAATKMALSSAVTKAKAGLAATDLAAAKSDALTVQEMLKQVK